MCSPRGMNGVTKKPWKNLARQKGTIVTSSRSGLRKGTSSDFCESFVDIISGGSAKKTKIGDIDSGDDATIPTSVGF